MHELLNSFQPPTEAQAHAIRASLGRQRLELIKLDAEIQLLLNKRERLEHAISSHELLLAPIRRLPDDVLRVIFVGILPERRNTALDEDEGGLLLCRVCRHWRDVALATPRLWASMHIVLPSGSYDNRGPLDTPPVKQLTQRMTLWMQRSAAVPISATVRFSAISGSLPSASSTPDPTVSPFLATLLSATSRWERIDLALCHPSDISALLDLTAEHVQRLKSFGMRLYSTAINRQFPAIRSDLRFLSAPSLESFSFYGHPLALPSTINWPNLVSLTVRFAGRGYPPLGAMPLDFPFPLLDHCTGLECLSIGAEGEHLRRQIPNSTPVVLSRMKTLQLSSTVDLCDLSSFREHLQMPNLETLTLSLVDLRSFVEPLGYLKALSISLAYFTAEHLRDGFRLLPALERLKIISDQRGQGSEEHILAAFVADRPVLCPQLTHVHVIRSARLSDNTILDFVRSRIPRLRSFKALLLLQQRPKQLDLPAEFSEAIADGLVLELVYQPPRGTVVPSYSPLEGTERHPGWMPDPILDGEVW
ncbi:F-box domain-containing protein [Mycena chlorophos]|uniref:F-box domain-containing protein n=1 Tax=Mycena chlorophos TaxID=658473 RepID=A0A8H6T1H4_MYCCL|nr:F-box domain-containing protein [Mycena chlorophos]